MEETTLELLNKVSKGELSPNKANKKLLDMLDTKDTFKIFLTPNNKGEVMFSIFDHELMVRNTASIDDFTSGLNELLKKNNE